MTYLTKNATRSIISASLLALSSLAMAADSINLTMSDPNGNRPDAGGVTYITANDNAPDQVMVTVFGLEPNRRFTAFLAASPLIGALPIQLLGEFTTDASGKAALSATTEVMDAFAASNVALTEEDGSAPPLAGALGRGAKSLPLDFIRVYQADANPGSGGTIFSADGVSPGVID